MIVISGCDKTGAAALMPLARTNAFGLVLYPGTSSPGKVDFGPWAAKGTNLLGVGLHSYGFTESGSFWLYYVFCPSQLALIVLGWLPARRRIEPLQA